MNGSVYHIINIFIFILMTTFYNFRWRIQFSAILCWFFGWSLIPNSIYFHVTDHALSDGNKHFQLATHFLEIYVFFIFFYHKKYPHDFIFASVVNERTARSVEKRGNCTMFFMPRKHWRALATREKTVFGEDILPA